MSATPKSHLESSQASLTVAGTVVHSAESARGSRLRRLARMRPSLANALFVIAPLSIVVMDVARRRTRLLALDAWHRGSYAAAVLESVVLWSLLLHAASRRRGVLCWVAALLFVVAFTFSVGGQTYFFQQYNAYLNIDVSLFASNFRDSIINQLSADIWNYLRAKLPPFALAIALVGVARRWLRPRRFWVRGSVVLAPIALVGSFFIPTQHRHLQAATPDVLYLNAVGGLLLTQFGFSEQSNQVRPRSRSSLPVPALAKAADTPTRNVLFVILESVRADSTCIEYDPKCQRTGSTNQLFPGRFGFNEMRSMDSTTAISLAVLWSGVAPNESRETLHTWPLVFDYARAAGFDTAFWTSQNMMFGNSRLWVKNLGVSKFASATDLDPTCDLDMGAPEELLADRVNAEIGSLREPFLAVVQLSNVHYPYYVNARRPEPFQPATTSKAPEHNPEFKNYYQNAVYQQDQHVARMLEHLRETDFGKRTVIVYTSDHAEAFREHGQMGHTFSLFDEEIHVPAWIDAPPNTLTESEQQSLRQKRDAYVFHVDLAPTILDLLGVLDDPGIARYRTRMRGLSLLRPALDEQPLVMTNCAGVWSCAFENWGVMQRNLKIESRAWDVGWKCHDVAQDPFELHNLPLSACGNLVHIAENTFGRLPGQGIAKSN